MELRPITDPEKVVNEGIRRCAKDGPKPQQQNISWQLRTAKKLRLCPWTSFPIRRNLSFYTCEPRAGARKAKHGALGCGAGAAWSLDRSARW
jgi:hypothetical protein